MLGWDTGFVVFVADDLGAWLISLLADAGRKKLTTVLVGTDQERALRSAATVAVRLTASQLREGDDQQAEQVALVISQVFGEPLLGSSLARYHTMLEALQAGIADQLAVLDDASLTGTGRSSADVLGVSAGVLAEELTGHLVREIVARGSRGGPLWPLADQLNHDVTHLQGQQTHDAVRELARTIREALASASLSPDNIVPGKDPDVLARSCLVLPNGRLPQVQEVSDPVTLGVHPSSRLSGFASPTGEPVGERVPPYVPRDVDDELRIQLADSRFVMVVGDSSAGKSRAAFEAVSTLGDHVLVVPRSREALTVAVDQAAKTRRCVLWLDDIERYLGPGGLSPADVARVLAGARSHRVIVATLRSAEETLLTDKVGDDEGGRLARKAAREVLELAFRVYLPRLFSQAETERAEARAWDPRIADAVAQASEYGIAEYLAAGPELMRDWENAWSPNTDPRAPSYPRAAALITAAVDIRRSGFTSPLPRSLVTDVHDHYLHERGGSRLQPEPIADAWAWATRTRRATTALLQDVDGEHVLLFDYLLDTVQRRSRPGDYVPDSVLAAALAVCAPSDADKMASTAYHHGRYQSAGTAWLTASRALAKTLGPEHPDTLAARESRANALRELGQPAEAESELRAIADIGARVLGPEHPQVLSARNSRALALIRLSRPAEAEDELRAVQGVSSRALGPEHDVTMTTRHLHAIALHNLGRLAEAEAENRSVLAAWTREFGPEDPGTLYSRGNLASILYDTGRREEAEAEARAVLDIRTRVFGPEHPDTLSIRARRAHALRELGRRRSRERATGHRGDRHARFRSGASPGAVSPQ